MSVRRVIIPNLGKVTLYKRRGNRSIRLILSASGDIKVTMPPWLSYKIGEQFALSRQDWIRRHRRRDSLFSSGQPIGKTFQLNIQRSPTSTKITTRLINSEIRVTHPVHFLNEHTAIQQAAHKASIRALRSEASQLLPGRLHAIADITHHSYNSVSIKQLKSRWGSCSSKRDITLNLFLMQLPWHLIDYVLTHELIHTTIMHHGPQFWHELEHHVPNARQLRKEIAQHQPCFTPSVQTVS